MDKEKKKKVIKEIISYVVIIVMVLLIKRYVVSPIKVNGSSMHNTLHDKDIMILNEIVYRFNDIKRYDIVVVEARGELLIKRVIALPGESISCKDGYLYINGKKTKDKYAYTETEDFKEVKVGKNEYFVMGDNRGDSLDSRVLGAFKKQDILGKASYTIFPFKRIGSKK